MRKLLVEDDALDAAAFRRGLPTATVEWAKTLHEAVERVACTEFDVLAVDLRLPDSDGIHAVNTLLRALGDAAPLVVLTGSDDAQLRADAKAAGAAAVMDKYTTDRSTLVERIGDVLAAHREADGRARSGASA